MLIPATDQRRGAIFSSSLSPSLTLSHTYIQTCTHPASSIRRSWSRSRLPRGKPSPVFCSAMHSSDPYAMHHQRCQPGHERTGFHPRSSATDSEKKHDKINTAAHSYRLLYDAWLKRQLIALPRTPPKGASAFTASTCFMGLLVADAAEASGM